MARTCSPSVVKSSPRETIRDVTTPSLLVISGMEEVTEPDCPPGFFLSSEPLPPQPAAVIARTRQSAAAAKRLNPFFNLIIFKSFFINVFKPALQETGHPQ